MSFLCAGRRKRRTVPSWSLCPKRWRTSTSTCTTASTTVGATAPPPASPPPHPRPTLSGPGTPLLLTHKCVPLPREPTPPRSNPTRRLGIKREILGQVNWLFILFFVHELTLALNTYRYFTVNFYICLI